jgi:bacterioferritin-associated ferredoxin
MYLCICNNVKQGEHDKYDLIGTRCGKCIMNIEKGSETELKRFVRSLLDPEGFGHAVTSEVRDEARHVLGMPKVETVKLSDN